MIFMKKIYFTILLFVACTYIFSQDVHFSQLSNSPLTVNPAYTGLFDGYQRAIINYRSQWTSAASPFKTMAASFDAEVGLKKQKNAYLGIGGMLFQDVAGAANWKQFRGDLIVNGIVKVGKLSHLAVAAGGGFAQNSADFNSLTFGNQYNGQEFSTELASNENIVFRNFTYNDISAGVIYEYDKTKVAFDHNDSYRFFVGFAGYHLNKPTQNYGGALAQKINQKFVATFAGQLDIKGTKMSVLSNNYYMMQGKFRQLNLGAMLRLRFNDQTKITGLVHETALDIGLNVRGKDAIIPCVMFEMKGFMVGLSYDYNFSTFRDASKGNGGFEISLKWTNLRDGIFRQGREFSSSKGGSQ
jgi:type IX secretion system PorP/SprF family membrane protein